MNLTQFISTVKQVCLLHKGIKQFNEGDVYEVMNSGTQHYPAIVLTINNLTGTEDQQSINCNMFYIDRLTDDESNKVDVQSESITVLKDIQAKLKENLAIEITVNSYTPFTQKFADLCAGSYLDCIMTIPENVICSDSNFDSRELEVKTNGTYSTIGYDKVKVATKTKADPVLESITIESNGTYAPPEGIDGYNSIDVNVPTPEPKLETLDVTANGTYDAPSTIDGYNKVVVDVPSIVNDPFGFDTIGYTPTTVPSIKSAVDYAKQIVDEWDSSSTNLDYRWYTNSEIQYMPYIDISNVTSCNRTFYGAKHLLYLPNNLDFSKCASFVEMFCGSGIKAAPNMDFSGDVSVDRMFADCNNLTTVPSYNVSEVTNFTGMFDQCTSLQSVGAMDMSNGVTFERIFASATSLPSNYLSPSSVMGWKATFDFPKATNLKGAFMGWTGMPELHEVTVNAADDSNFDEAFHSNYVNTISLGSTKPQVIQHICDQNAGVETFCADGLDCSRVRASTGCFNFCYNLKNIGILHNLGQAFNEGPLDGYDSWYKFNPCAYTDGSNVTDESLQNLVDSLYDVSGYNLNATYGNDATFMLNSGLFGRLTGTQQEAITAKGWIIVEGDE